MKMSMQLGTWEALGALAGPIRLAVFVDEQKVPLDMEWDEWDARSLHALARLPDGAAVGTGRLLPDGHIGRMAVLAPWRGQGVGAAMLAALMAEARARGLPRVVLHAQISALGFYEKAGFVPEGDPFEEAGIIHRVMSRVL